MHPAYDQWLTHVFAHDVTTPQWHFTDTYTPFDGTDADYAELLTLTFTRSGTDLARYSDAQVDQGLWYLASPSSSDYLFALRNGQAPLAQKLQGIHSILHLYRDCFAARCTPTLSHLDEPDSSPLNGIAYMFWDICALSCLYDAPDKAALEDAVFTVLAETLKIPHRACIEGGLHGLGEMVHEYPERVHPIIDAYLHFPTVDPALHAYALKARDGHIQ